MPIDTSHNSSFSKELPGMQIGLDSTSLGEFKTCPRKYQYGIVEGWGTKTPSPHLTFGIHLHQGRERYDGARAQGADHEEALDVALQGALQDTWDSAKGRPWLSDHPLKNRGTLIQTLVWYLDAFGKDDPLQTLLLANGKPAVELSFRFDAGIETSTGERVLLCGHLDRLAYLNDEVVIADIKTSSRAVDGQWAKQFSPGNQFSMYALAGRIAFGMEIKRLVVDGVQVGVGFARFHRHPVERTEGQLDEWLRDTKRYVRSMEQCAEEQYWPQNDKSCSMWGGCPFMEVCGRSPAARKLWLETNFTKRVWDPLVSRGEE